MGPVLTPVSSSRKGITSPRPTIRAWIQGPYRRQFLSPGRWDEGSKSWHPQPLDPGGTPGPRAVESSAPAGLCFSSTAPASRGRRRPGTPGGDRRLLRVGGAGRGQWAVRGALRSAGPRCTVSVKLQQLTGHRNLITQPCPFPTPLGPGEPSARGRRGAKTAPCKTGKGWGRCTEISWLRNPAASPFPACCSPCPLEPSPGANNFGPVTII